MTDQKDRVVSKRIGTPGTQSLATTKLLQISGSDPRTVYVKDLGVIDGKRRIGFSLQPEGDFFDEGIQWTPSNKNPDDDEYAMFLTCVFVSSNIVEITCATLHYSATFAVAAKPGRQQNLCVPWGPAAYSFDVELLPEGGVPVVIVDPIIIVTPIIPQS